MSNKEYLKKCIKRLLVIMFIFITLFLLLKYFEYSTLKKNYNEKLNSLIYTLTEEYDIDKKDIVNILSDSSTKPNVLTIYGLDKEIDNLIFINSEVEKKYTIIFTSVFFLFITLILLTVWTYSKKINNSITDITKLIKKINKKNYEFNMSDISEDELSILKSEIYKTTIMLKEDSELSKKDKLSIKTSLEDISHQIKTPLTSILIMLDNLSDKSVTKDKKEEFIMDIKREITNINFLVTNLLKLSKLDTNTITFKKGICSLEEIISTSIKNVSTLCDLKNIKVVFSCPSKESIICDSKWQTEALTNILKNACEHSYQDEDVIVEVIVKKLYKEVIIKNKGEQIKKENIAHIFDRFNSFTTSSNNFGIGLSLSKAIIEHDNGRINVKTDDDYTIFTIKYFNF